MLLLSIFAAFLLICTGMSVVFAVYFCLVWFATRSQRDFDPPPAPAKASWEEGLPASELAKLPKITGKELTKGTECVVCLEEMEREDAVRLVPACNHGFHVQCGDEWFSKNSVCPVCRAKVEPQQPSKASENLC